MRLAEGFPDGARDHVARMFWAAFADKLGRILGPEDRALGFVGAALRPQNALSVVADDGRLLGIAGVKTVNGGLVAGGYPDLARWYGPFGAVWRGALLDLLDRTLNADQMLLDGLFVDPAARGLGVGTVLIGGVLDLARRQGFSEVRLDVIDSNARARALYEREGFRPVGGVSLRTVGWLYGFRYATTMVRPVTA